MPMRRMIHIRIFGTILLWMAVSLLGACSANPATGERSFTGFMSLEDELETGCEQHPLVIQRYGGLYQDSILISYVARVGRSLALVENEAELAGVLAHEIGHVTARRSARRDSASQAANIGLTVLGVAGSILGAPVGAGQALGFGAELSLKVYSREQELEADLLAVRYLARAGYDTGALRTFFQIQLETEITAAQQGALAGGGGGLLSTHPRTSDRIIQAMGLAQTQAPPHPFLGREASLSRVNGLVFGQDRGGGVRDGRRFILPDRGLGFTLPPGYAVENTRSRVIAREPDNGLILFEALKPEAVSKAGGALGYVQGWWRTAGLRRAARHQRFGSG